MTSSSRVLATSVDIERHEALRLLMTATGRTRADLLIGVDLTDDEVARYAEMVARRRGGEPLQYVEGAIPFGPADISVDARALIPRPETELLFEIACGLVDRPAVIVDLCTGSGNLAIALAMTFPEAAVYATDVSPDAAALARGNADRNGVEVSVLVGDLFSPLPDAIEERVDLIVANPPYLAAYEYDELPEDVKREPRQALVAGPDGDEIVAAIGRGATSWLRPGGALVCEISEFAPERSLAHFSGIAPVLTHDLDGKPRFVVAGRDRE